MAGMKLKSLKLSDPLEAAVVDRIQVRLIKPEEKARWDEVVVEHHYLRNAQRVGEQLRYVVEGDGKWLAVLGWSAAAYHLQHREARIGEEGARQPMGPVSQRRGKSR